MPGEWLSDFVPFAGWQLLVLPGYHWLRTDPDMRRRLIALHVSIVGLMAVATMLTTVVFVPVVSQLYFWRLAPFAVLLAQVVLMTGIVQRVATAAAGRPGAPWPVGRTSQWWRAPLQAARNALLGMDRRQLFVFGCGAVGWVAVVLHYVRGQGLFDARPLTLIAATAALPAVTLLPARPAGAAASPRMALHPIRFRPRSLGAATGTAFALFLALALAQLPVAIEESNLLNPDSPPAEQALFEWARTTNRDARFLIPPSLAAFRLHARRAVVVDWKSTPILADELVEWYRRIARVSGLRSVPDLAAASRGYLALDSARLASLAAEFEPDYAVIPAASPLARSASAVAYRNSVFTVLDLRRFRDTADAAASTRPPTAAAR